MLPRPSSWPICLVLLHLAASHDEGEGGRQGGGVVVTSVEATAAAAAGVEGRRREIEEEEGSDPSEPLLKTLWGHTRGVTSVAADFAAGLALSGGEDWTLRLWNLSDGSCLRTFGGHMDGVTSVAADFNLGLALSGSYDKTLKLWNLWSGACLRSFTHADAVLSLAADFSLRRVLTGGREGKLYLRSFDDAEEEFSYLWQGSAVSSVVADFSSNQALSGSYAKPMGLKLWDLHSRTCVQTLGANIYAGQVFANFTLRQALSAGSLAWDTDALQWDLGKGLYERAFVQVGVVLSMVVDFARQWAVFGLQDRRVRLWDLSRGVCLQDFDGKLGHSGAVSGVAVDFSRGLLLSGSEDTSLKLWRLTALIATTTTTSTVTTVTTTSVTTTTVTTTTITSTTGTTTTSTTSTTVTTTTTVTRADFAFGVFWWLLSSLGMLLAACLVGGFLRQRRRRAQTECEESNYHEEVEGPSSALPPRGSRREPLLDFFTNSLRGQAGNPPVAAVQEEADQAQVSASPARCRSTSSLGFGPCGNNVGLAAAEGNSEPSQRQPSAQILTVAWRTKGMVHGVAVTEVPVPLTASSAASTPTRACWFGAVAPTRRYFEVEVLEVSEKVAVKTLSIGFVWPPAAGSVASQRLRGSSWLPETALQMEQAFVAGGELPKAYLDGQELCKIKDWRPRRDLVVGSVIGALLEENGDHFSLCIFQDGVKRWATTVRMASRWEGEAHGVVDVCGNIRKVELRQAGVPAPAQVAMPPSASMAAAFAADVRDSSAPS